MPGLDFVSSGGANLVLLDQGETLCWVAGRPLYVDFTGSENFTLYEKIDGRNAHG